MQEFIEQVSGQLGIDSSQAGSATGGILNMIKGKLDQGEFSQLLEKLPGAEGLVADAESGQAEASGGGGLGGLLGKASSMMGGAGGGVANIAGILGKSGLSLDKAGPFLGKLMGFLRDKLPSGLFQKIQGAVPDVDSE